MKADSSLFTYPHHDCSENQTAHLDEVSQIVLEGQGLLLMLCVYILSEILAREGGREGERDERKKNYTVEKRNFQSCCMCVLVGLENEEEVEEEKKRGKRAVEWRGRRGV